MLLLDDPLTCVYKFCKKNKTENKLNEGKNLKEGLFTTPLVSLISLGPPGEINRPPSEMTWEVHYPGATAVCYPPYLTSQQPPSEASTTLMSTTSAPLANQPADTPRKVKPEFSGPLFQ